MVKINFFEEFPTESALSKAALIDFHSMVFIAAGSYKDYLLHEGTIKRYNPDIETAYWPIFEKSYWVSPFSYPYEIEQLYCELKSNRMKLIILLDLELPFLNKKLFLKNLFHFRQNKKAIRQIFSESQGLNIEILTAEYPLSGRITNSILRFLGISYPVSEYPHKKIVMFYTSMIRRKSVFNHIRKHIIMRSREMGDNYHVGLGCLDIGILGNEPLITAGNLDNDLRFLEETGVKTATLFQLSGLNGEYLRVIRKHALKS